MSVELCRVYLSLSVIYIGCAVEKGFYGIIWTMRVFTKAYRYILVFNSEKEKWFFFCNKIESGFLLR